MIVAALLVVWLYRHVLLPCAPGGDFVNHRIWGSRFVEHCHLYEGGLNVPYPPFWAVPHAPLARMPETLAFAIYKALGLAAFATVLALATAGRQRVALTLFLVLIVARPFVLRDLHDGGPNLIILALAWTGMVTWARGRGGVGAVCLGLAIALKCTPAVFLLYFAARRRWGMLASTLGVAALFSLTPILWQGTEGFRRHVEIWWMNMRAGMAAAPGSGVIGAEEMRNCSLRAALGRQLVDLPPGHPGRLVHPWRIQAFHLAPVVANHIVRVALVVLVAIVLLRLCRSVGDDERSEWAAMALLMPLLSPIAWNQHCVAAIPALVLLFRRAVAGGRPRLALMLTLLSGFYVVGLNRALTSAMGAGLIASYGLVTLSLLMLLAACLSAAREAPAPRAGQD
jgi:alpha-1,2-mannosyltransferase